MHSRKIPSTRLGRFESLFPRGWQYWERWATRSELAGVGIGFEEILDEEFSPLNQPVVDNEIGHGKEVAPSGEETNGEQPDEAAQETPSIEADFDQNIYDAPEQEIGEPQEEAELPESARPPRRVVIAAHGPRSCLERCHNSGRGV